jgi:hypothetical protein
LGNETATELRNLHYEQTTACEVIEILMLRPWPSLEVGGRRFLQNVCDYQDFLTLQPALNSSLFHRGNIEITFHIPRNPNMGGSPSVAAGEASCVAKRNEPTHNTVKHDLKYEPTKTKQKKTKKQKKKKKR